MSFTTAAIRRRRALAFHALLRRARRRAAGLGRRPYPDEHVGQTPPPYVMVLQKQGQAATHELGSAYHADLARRHARVHRDAVRLAARGRRRDELEELSRYAADNRDRPRRRGVAASHIVLLLIIVLEAALTKVVLELLGASDRVTWAAAYAVAFAQMVGAHLLGGEAVRADTRRRAAGAGKARERSPMTTAMVVVLLAGLAGTTVLIGLLRGLRLISDQEQLAVLGFRGMTLWQAVGMFVAIQTLINGVALFVGARHARAEAEGAVAAGAGRWRLGACVVLARWRERRSRAAYEAHLVRLAGRCGEFREWARQLVERYGAVIASSYDGLTSTADVEVAGVHAGQPFPVVELPSWLSEAEDAERRARAELERFRTMPNPRLAEIDLRDAAGSNGQGASAPQVDPEDTPTSPLQR